MTVRYVKSSGGSESNGGTSMSDAWKYPPGMTGSTHDGDVSGGDEIAIANGSSYTGRRLRPIANVSYYGYGLGGTQITIKKVVKGKPYLTYDYAVARVPGVHQGSWSLATGSLGSAGVLDFANSGASVADVVIDGDPTPGTSRPTVRMGTTHSVTSATLRRACVLNSTDIGIKAVALNVTLDQVQVLSSEQDCITCGSEVAGDYGNGGALIMTDIDCRNPNYDRNGNHVSSTGDLFQCLHTQGIWKRSLLFDGFYGYKLDSVKQGIVLHDMLNGFTLRNLHIHGSPTSNTTFDIGSVRGVLLIEDAYFYEGCHTFHLLRLNPAGDAPGETDLTQILYATGHVILRRILVDGSVGGFTGMLTLASTHTPSGALDGKVTVESCIGKGPGGAFTDNFVTLWKSGMEPTIGTLQANIRNNVSFGSGSDAHIALPPGVAGNKDYVVTNNFFPASSVFSIGSTEYSSVAAFEAAHAYATTNNDANTWNELLINADYSVANASPLLTAGIWWPHNPSQRQIV